MKQSSVGRVAQKMRGAAGRALASHRKLAGKPTDNEIIYYNTLKPEDFEALRAGFGDEAVNDYIHRMEMRLMKNG